MEEADLCRGPQKAIYGGIIYWVCATNDDCDCAAVSTPLETALGWITLLAIRTVAGGHFFSMAQETLDESASKRC